MITRNKTAAEVWAENKPRIMYCLARAIWRKQNDLTPSGKCTWAQRFRQIFGREYREYTDEIMAQGRADKGVA